MITYSALILFYFIETKRAGNSSELLLHLFLFLLFPLDQQPYGAYLEIGNKWKLGLGFTDKLQTL